MQKLKSGLRERRIKTAMAGLNSKPKHRRAIFLFSLNWKFLPMLSIA